MCVSDNFDVKIIVEKILECIKNEKPEVPKSVSENSDGKIIVQSCLECIKNEKPKDLNTLVNDVHKKINGKRYMIVLDDVWNEDCEKWFSLKKILMGGARGSRIVMTTRSQKVAKISQPSQPHVLQGLEEQHAWSLFKKM